MNGLMRVALLRSFLPVPRPSFLTPAANCVLATQVNTIFGPGALGIDGFREKRKEINAQFGPLKGLIFLFFPTCDSPIISFAEKFFIRMGDVLEDPKQDRLVFTDDLKNVTYLIENNPKEIDLLVELLRKFATQNRDLRFGKFIFGPVVMRLLHEFRLPDIALTLIRDPAFEGFFNQMTSYIICLDLLYKCDRFQDVIDVYDEIMEKGALDNATPRDLTTLAIVSAYRIGDAKAYQKAKELINIVKRSGSFVSARSVCVFVMFANKQNEPQLAFECLTLLNTFPATARSIKIVTLCNLKRTEEAFIVMKSYLLQSGSRNQFQAEFTEDALSVLRDAIAEANDQQLSDEFERTMETIRNGGHVSQKTIDDMLLSEMEYRRSPRAPNRMDNRRSFIGDAGYRDSREREQYPYKRRSPGL